MNIRLLVNESTLRCPACDAAPGNAHSSRDCFDLIQWAANVPDQKAETENEKWQRQRIAEAARLIAAAVQIMTPEQVGQWAGVRAWQEDDGR